MRSRRRVQLGITDAYDAYLEGLVYSDKNTEPELRKSLEFFQQALEKDPKFSRAWTGIAKVWLWLADAYRLPLSAYPRVRDAALRALELDHEEAEAHVYLAETKRILDWDLDGAEAEFNRAVEIDLNSMPLLITSVLRSMLRAVTATRHWFTYSAHRRSIRPRFG